MLFGILLYFIVASQTSTPNKGSGCIACFFVSYIPCSCTIKVSRELQCPCWWGISISATLQYLYLYRIDYLLYCARFPRTTTGR